MDANKYKIGIIGLGPVGLTIAAHLREAGCDIAICDVLRDKINLIRSSGIHLVGKVEKTCFVNYSYYSLDELLRDNIDILICASKAYHVNSILDTILQIRPQKDFFVLSAQNGIGVAQMYAKHFEEKNIFRMVVNFAGNLNAPNAVNVTFFNPPNYLASRDDSQPEVADWIAEILSSVKLNTVSLDSFELRNKIWEKTILNAALSPLCAIAKLTMREAMANPDTHEIVEKLIMEATLVANAEEIKLPDNFVKLCIRYLKNAGDHFPSLAVDLMNKSNTEINFMNGKIVEFGKKHYIRTPLNLTFTNLVRAITEKNLNKY
ncbi:MAG: 2-dehydropantoate 2-reductase [Candidatus Kapabacteria bacterium]|nr:2-dehydropantoate 2-reductase [Candidatus Kapabacteria bacterium]